LKHIHLTILNVLFCFLLLSWKPAVSQSSPIIRVEPPHWWSDMTYSAIELMIYGDRVGLCEVDVQGLEVTGVHRTENPRYLFVTIETKGAPPGVYPIVFKRGKKKVATIQYRLQDRVSGSAARRGFDASDVIYLIMPDRFANGDTTNDSHPTLREKAHRKLAGGRHGGDLKGIMNQLDYLQNLGVTAIWTTPFMEDNDSTFSYHGYGQSDLYKVDPRYGSNELYAELVRQAKAKGIKMIMDVVPNHWGASHWMISDLPTYDWIHQFPGYGQTHYRMSTQMDPYVSDIDMRYGPDGWFVPSMPDLNQNNPLVLRYLIQNTLWWLEFAQIDGLRVDTYSYADKEGVSTWTKAIMDEYPQLNVVGEVWLHQAAQISYWQKNSPIGQLQHFNSHLPSVMDFCFHDAASVAFLQPEMQWDKGLIHFYEHLVNDFLYDNPYQLLVFSENHDTKRFNESHSFQDYTCMMAILTTIRGIPQIYYGSEVGMKGDKDKGDADIRRDFPGGWKNDPINAFNPKERTPEQQQYHDVTARLLQWRKSTPVIHWGKTKQFIPQNNVWVYFRYDDTDTVMVIVNNSLEEVSIPVSHYAEMLIGFQTASDVLTGATLDLSATHWTITPKTPYIITLAR